MADAAGEHADGAVDQEFEHAEDRAEDCELQLHAAEARVHELQEVSCPHPFAPRSRRDLRGAD